MLDFSANFTRLERPCFCIDAISAGCCFNDKVGLERVEPQQPAPRHNKHGNTCIRRQGLSLVDYSKTLKWRHAPAPSGQG